MSIPLVQNNEKDSINTSIIAIKRNIERINMLLGLVDSGSPDLSGLATKQELEDAITQVETDLAPVDEVTSGNMQSVTSNAVAEELQKIEDITSQVNILYGTATVLKYGKIIQITGSLPSGTAGNTITITNIPKAKQSNFSIYGVCIYGNGTTTYARYESQRIVVLRNASQTGTYTVTYIAE